MHNASNGVYDTVSSSPVAMAAVAPPVAAKPSVPDVVTTVAPVTPVL